MKKKTTLIRGIFSPNLSFILLLIISAFSAKTYSSVSEAIITPNSPVNYEYFGTEVSLSGEYAFVAYKSNVSTDEKGGRVTVFKQSAGEWVQTQTLHRTSQVCDNVGYTMNHSFGTSLDSEEDWLIVGAPLWKSVCGVPSNGSIDGTVFVYKRNGELYEDFQILPAPDNQNSQQFGSSISISGNWLFVGSVGAKHINSSNQIIYGATYVYHYNDAAGVWEYAQKLYYPNNTQTKDFGRAVAVSGNHALISSSIGAYNVPQPQRGVVYAYQLSGESWSLVEAFEYYDTSVSIATLGYSIGMSGDVAAMGTDRNRTVSIYRLVDGSWEFEQVFANAGISTFGYRVAVEGDYVLASAETGTVSGGQSTSGFVNLYKYENDEWALDQTIAPSDAVYGGAFGKSIALNQGRILAGSPDYNSTNRRGKAYVYSGAIQIPSLTAKFSMSDFIIGQEKDVHFTDLSTAENTTITSWSWDFNEDGVADSNDQNPVHEFWYPGTYQVKLTISDGSISSSSTQLITILSASEDTCFVYIPFQGLEREQMGVAAWNVIDGGDFELPNVGHLLPQPPASIAVAYYYIASRDYGDLDPNAYAAMHSFESNLSGWSNLKQALLDNGFTADDLTISFSTMSLGDDIQGEDWQLYGNYENRTYTGGTFNFSIDGERIVSGLVPDLELHLEYHAYQGSSDKIWGKTGYTTVYDSAGKNASEEALNVGNALLNDIGSDPVMFLFSSLQPANQFEFSTSKRYGGYFDVQRGYVIKACSEQTGTSIEKSTSEPNYRQEGNSLTISDIPLNSTIKVHDLAGKNIYHQTNTASKSAKITLRHQGIYVLSIETPERIFSRKVIF